jgi:phenylpropionate dioxygenase-like ring-hydroxylating dioxygenase large terminal subunit
MMNKSPPIPQSIIDYPKLTYETLTEQDKYDLQWYVIGTPSDFSTDRPKKIKIWNKNYVVWKDERGQYTGLDDVCSHKGASLSGGYINNGQGPSVPTTNSVDDLQSSKKFGSVVCPYHGYEFDQNGVLQKVPGICFQPSPVQNLAKFDVVEKHGWIYLNTFSDLTTDKTAMQENIFVEQEVGRNDSVVFLDMDFNCYSRILSENSLDVMHIGFVHTFGNRKNPAPIEIHPPKLMGSHHFKTSYKYEAGEMSLARRYFKVKDLIIENEFILPHTTIARVIFGEFVSTVVTFALPISENKSKLFVKTYRNFWQNPMGDKISRDLMYQTMLQDKAIVENISPLLEDGKFNMRFDKLQNTYKTFYKKFVHKKKDL